MSSISKLAYLILTASIGYAFIYPSVGDLSMLLDEKQKYENTLEMVGKIEDKKNELLSEFNNISAADKKDIETFLPSSMDFVRFVSQIDAVAAKYGISINNVSSKETSGSIGESIENAQSPEPYEMSTISFSFKASYDKFNTFIGDLQKSLRILDVRSVKLRAEEDGIYDYDVEFVTYWLKPL